MRCGKSLERGWHIPGESSYDSCVPDQVSSRMENFTSIVHTDFHQAHQAKKTVMSDEIGGFVRFWQLFSCVGSRLVS